MKSMYEFNLVNLLNKLIEFNLISDKTHDRINILNKIRRFGTHSKTGATLEDDASFVFNCYKQALIEMFS